MDSAQDALNLSVVLITLNEETRIIACLQSLPRGSEICVLDSGSTDRTVELARSFGARVEHRPFTNHAEQKNAAIALATRPWILSIDADETVSEPLRRSILTAIAAGPGAGPNGFRVHRGLVFMGRRMRFGKTWDRPLRLFRRGQGRFESDIHEQLILSAGAPGVLQGELWHYSYENLSDYFQRFNLYTSKVAENHERHGRGMPLGPLHILRPWVEFVNRYVFRLGFLDGYPGYTYALLSAFYTYVKYAKLKERLDRQALGGQAADRKA